MRTRTLIGLLLALSLAASACAAAAPVVTDAAVQLTGNVVISVVRGEPIELAFRRAAATSRNPLVTMAAVVGTFVLDDVPEDTFEDDGSYVIINHLVADESVTTVVRIEDSGNLGIKVQGEADVYPFEDGRIVFDALPYENTEITVFNRDSGIEVFAEGTIDLPSDGEAFDLETGTIFEVSDESYPPRFADLYFDEDEEYAALINGTTAVARHGVPGSLDACRSVPEEAWRDNLAPSDVSDIGEGWCIRSSEDELGFIEAVDGDLRFKMWVTD